MIFDEIGHRWFFSTTYSPISLVRGSCNLEFSVFVGIRAREGVTAVSGDLKSSSEAALRTLNCSTNQVFHSKLT